MIQITFTLDDAPLEADIQQVQIDMKVAGIPADQFLENAARSGFEQFRGARKRLVQNLFQELIILINTSDTAQAQVLVDFLTQIKAKLEELQPKP